MTISIVKTRIKSDQDVAFVRRRARQMAVMFLLEGIKSTRFATAVSEITRNAFIHGSGGMIEFVLETSAIPPRLEALVIDHGPGIPGLANFEDESRHLDSMGGLRGSRRLVDHFRIKTELGVGTTVVVGMHLPKEFAKLTGRELMQHVEKMSQQRTQTLAEELEHQNRELFVALEQLSDHQLELQEEHRRKDEFLAILGHELRNPLAAISNAVAYAGIEPTPSMAANAFAIIGRQTKQLSRLIEDLLDVSRIAQGKSLVKLKAVKASEVVANAIEMTSGLIDSARHDFVLDMEKSDIWIMADLTRLSQALGNLLNNAVKFTSAGGHIRLSVTYENHWAVFSIADDGAGIDPLFMPRMFEMFAQGAPGTDQAASGLGIGLNVVRSITELHGGDVSVQSDGLNKGSRFVLRIPVTEKPSFPVEPQVVASDRTELPMRVLIVDDNTDSADSLAMCLEMWGHEVRTASDGHSGLQGYVAWKPDFVILDIGLPKMNGFEVAKAIRAEEAITSPVLIALSGYSRAENEIDNAYSAFDHYMLKPVSPNVLRDLISTHST